jgi:hypothetical protein
LPESRPGFSGYLYRQRYVALASFISQCGPAMSRPVKIATDIRKSFIKNGYGTNKMRSFAILTSIMRA